MLVGGLGSLFFQMLHPLAMAGVADHSRYLWTLVMENPARLVRLLERPPGVSLNALIQALAARRDEFDMRDSMRE